MEQTKDTKKESVCTNPGQRAKRRILVVEDNRSVRDILSVILHSMGFEVALAKNGLEALTAFMESAFDVVLTDLQMPIMDGSKLAHLIKVMSPETPVILLTGTDVETVKEKVKTGPVDSLIFKPFKVDDLQNTLQGALELKEAEQGGMRAV
jgi:two-component system, NtrC family, response regulator PilR